MKVQEQGDLEGGVALKPDRWSFNFSNSPFTAIQNEEVPSSS